MKTPVKKRIERIKEIKKREVILAKDFPRGRLKRVNASLEKKDKVFFDIDRYPESYFTIHTHPPYPTGKALVSIADIDSLLGLMSVKKTKTGVIANLSKKGKVAGYTFFKVKLNRHISEKKWFQIMKQWEGLLQAYKATGSLSSRNRTAYHEKVKKFLDSFGIQLKVKQIAMPGYKFNPKTARFRLKKKESK